MEVKMKRNEAKFYGNVAIKELQKMRKVLVKECGWADKQKKSELERVISSIDVSIEEFKSTCILNTSEFDVCCRCHEKKENLLIMAICRKCMIWE